MGHPETPGPVVPHPDTDAGWTMILEPRRPWLDLRLRELWHARDLILLFVRRDFLATYKRTVLGLGLGFGIIISSLTTGYRDLAHLVTFGVQLLMYAAPVSGENYP